MDNSLFQLKAGECVSAQGSLLFELKDGRKIKVVPNGEVKNQILLYINSRNADDTEIGQKFVRLSTCTIALVATPGQE